MVKSSFCSSFTLTTFRARKQMLQSIEANRDITNRTLRYLGSNLQQGKIVQCSKIVAFLQEKF